MALSKIDQIRRYCKKSGSKQGDFYHFTVKSGPFFIIFYHFYEFPLCFSRLPAHLIEGFPLQVNPYLKNKSGQFELSTQTDRFKLFTRYNICENKRL